MSSDIGSRIRELTATVIEAMKELRQLKKDHPDHSCGHYMDHGSILNAYREGDLTFDEAKAELKAIPIVKAQRKIIHITSCQVENTSQTQCQMMVTALCDDGTMWATDNCSMFEGCERQAWHQIRPIPQVDESADLDTAITRP